MTESPKSFFSYNFTNVETGKLLRINSGFTGVEKNTKVEDKNANKDFVFDVASATTLKGGVYAGTSNDNLYVYSSASPYNGLSWANNVSTVSTTASAPIFYEVKSEMLTDAEELNALYNTMRSTLQHPSTFQTSLLCLNVLRIKVRSQLATCLTKRW